jgi:hypothetical protein
MTRREKAYATTQVAVSKTQEDIRKLLVRHSARGMQLTEVFEPPSLCLRFQVLIGDDRQVLAMVNMEVPTGADEARSEREADQYRRQAARALFYYLKSQLEAIDFGLVRFEEAFLAHFEIPTETGVTTIGQRIVPEFVAASAQAVPKLLPRGEA